MSKSGQYTLMVVVVMVLSLTLFFVGEAMRSQTAEEMSLPPLPLPEMAELNSPSLVEDVAVLPDPATADNVVAQETEDALNAQGLSATSMVKLSVSAKPLPPVVQQAKVVNVGQ